MNAVAIETNPDDFEKPLVKLVNLLYEHFPTMFDANGLTTIQDGDLNIMLPGKGGKLVKALLNEDAIVSEVASANWDDLESTKGLLDLIREFLKTWQR